MARYFCERCNADCNTLDPPHLCKDLKKRYERQAKAIAKINAIFERYGLGANEELAVDIVRAISGLDLEDT